MSYFGKLLMSRKIRDEVPAELASTRAKPDNRPDMVRGNCGSSPHRLSNPSRQPRESASVGLHGVVGTPNQKGET